MIMNNRQSNCCCWLLFQVFKGWIYHHISFSYEVAQGYFKAQFNLIVSSLEPTPANGHIGLVNGEFAKEVCDAVPNLLILGSIQQRSAFDRLSLLLTI